MYVHLHRLHSFRIVITLREPAQAGNIVSSGCRILAAVPSWRSKQILPRRFLLLKCHSVSPYTHKCNFLHADKNTSSRSSLRRILRDSQVLHGVMCRSVPTSNPNRIIYMEITEKIPWRLDVKHVLHCGDFHETRNHWVALRIQTWNVLVKIYFSHGVKCGCQVSRLSRNSGSLDNFS